MKRVVCGLFGLAVSSLCWAECDDNFQLPPLHLTAELTSSVVQEGNLFHYRYGLVNPADSSFHVVGFEIYLASVYRDENGLEQIEIRRTSQASTTVPLGWRTFSCLHPFYYDPSSWLPCSTVHCPDDDDDPYNTPACWKNRGSTFPLVAEGTSWGLPVITVAGVFGDERLAFKEWVDPHFDTCGEFFETPDEYIEAVTGASEREVYALGPGSPRGSWEQWDLWLASVNKARELNWIRDEGLYQRFREKIGQARAAAAVGRAEEVNQLLHEVEQMATAASDDQLSSEVRAVLIYNAQGLRGPIPPPCEARLIAMAEQVPVWPQKPGEVWASLRNQKDGQPIVGEPLEFGVHEGLYKGTRIVVPTNERGEAKFSLPPPHQKGESEWTVRVGPTPTKKPLSPSSPLARVVEKQDTGPCRPTTQLVVPGFLRWEAPLEATDLAVTNLVPPFVLSGPGRTVIVREVTANVGNVGAAGTVTRYYITNSDTLDPAEAKVLGERQVPPLGGGEESESEEFTFVIPDSVLPGKLYLFACADATGVVEEYNEKNNCSRGVVGFSTAALVPDLQVHCRLPVGFVGKQYEGGVAVAGGWGGYHFDLVSGALPPGLVLTPDGRVVGTPTEAGQYAFRVHVKDETVEPLEGAADCTVMISQAGGEAIPTLSRTGVWGLVAVIGFVGAVAIGVWWVRRQEAER